MRPFIMVVAFAGLAALSACSTGKPLAAAEQSENAAVGRDLVVRECASCHAIDQNKASPRPDAPPMNTLLARYDPEMLAEDLIEGIRVGHDDMPHFDFNPIAADALVAYLESIESKE